MDVNYIHCQHFTSLVGYLKCPLPHSLPPSTGAVTSTAVSSGTILPTWARGKLKVHGLLALVVKPEPWHIQDLVLPDLSKGACTLTWDRIQHTH